MRKHFRLVLVAALLVLIFFGGRTLKSLNGQVRLGVGYMMKIICSEVFVADRDLDDVLNNDFHGIDPLLSKVKIDIDDNDGSVTGNLYGLGKMTAYYRTGLGCAIAPGGRPESLSLQTSTPPFETVSLNLALDDNIQTAVEAFFKNAAPNDNAVTRGVIVLKDGKIVGEGYGTGFDKTTLQQSWSMAKSVTQALIGIASSQGLITVSETDLFESWAGDERKTISVNDLLHMNSGLHFTEIYNDPKSTVTEMLFKSSDMGERALSEPLEHTPGTHWSYSSGTSNILSKLLRERLEAAGEDYHSFAARALFHKIGIKSAVFETDADGTFVGSSFLYATARDWARLGQLYLNDGVWGNAPILPKGWVDYARRPAMETTPYYGAHWWLNQDQDKLPDMSKDVYYMGGHDGQYVIVIPSKQAVIVRLGLLRPPASFDTDIYPLIKDIYDAL